MEQVFAPPKRFSSLESRIWQIPMPGRERVPQENGVAVGCTGRGWHCLRWPAGEKTAGSAGRRKQDTTETPVTRGQIQSGTGRWRPGRKRDGFGRLFAPADASPGTHWSASRCAAPAPCPWRPASGPAEPERPGNRPGPQPPGRIVSGKAVQERGGGCLEL